jgi:hypothetical protein
MDLIPSIRLRLLRLQNLPENRKQKYFYNVHKKSYTYVQVDISYLNPQTNFDVSMNRKRNLLCRKRLKLWYPFGSRIHRKKVLGQ